MKRYGICLALMVISSCKPPKYDQMIICPTFSATNVFVYRWDAGTYLVGAKGEKPKVVSDHECVVEAMR